MLLNISYGMWNDFENKIRLISKKKKIIIKLLCNIFFCRLDKFVIFVFGINLYN